MVAAISGAPSSFILRQLDPFICRTSKDCQLSSCLDRNHDDFDDDDDDDFDDDDDDDEASRVTIPDKLGMCRNGNV